jgi:hypothetical protein
MLSPQKIVGTGLKSAYIDGGDIGKTATVAQMAEQLIRNRRVLANNPYYVSQQLNQYIFLLKKCNQVVNRFSPVSKRVYGLFITNKSAPEGEALDHKNPVKFNDNFRQGSDSSPDLILLGGE